MNVYENCPRLESEKFLLRQTCMDDCDDLLKVYSDPAAWPIFNCDNCTGDFRMTKIEDMANCIRFWQHEYSLRYYVRWSVVDKTADSVIGTIELFHRSAQDFYDHVGLLRLDLRSDYENKETIVPILSLLLPKAWELFQCDVIATKIPGCAQKRRDALGSMGFRYSPELLYGHDGRAYGEYYLLKKEDLSVL